MPRDRHTPRTSVPCLASPSLTTVQGRVGSLRTLRWVIVTLGLALGAYLIARGDLIVGVLVGGSAVLRTVYLLSVSRAWNRRANQPAGPRDPNQVRRLLRGLAHNAFEIAGGVVGVNPVELRRGFQQGRSIAEAAAARGVPVDAVIRAVVDDASASLDRAVAEGSASPQTVAQARARLQTWAARLIYGTRGEFQGSRGVG